MKRRFEGLMAREHIGITSVSDATNEVFDGNANHLHPLFTARRPD